MPGGLRPSLESGRNKAVTQSAAQVCAMRLPTEVLEEHLRPILEGLLLWSEDSKNKFKLKVRHRDIHFVYLTVPVPQLTPCSMPFLTAMSRVPYSTGVYRLGHSHVLYMGRSSRTGLILNPSSGLWA